MIITAPKIQGKFDRDPKPFFKFIAKSIAIVALVLLFLFLFANSANAQLTSNYSVWLLDGNSEQKRVNSGDSGYTLSKFGYINNADGYDGVPETAFNVNEAGCFTTASDYTAYNTTNLTIELWYKSSYNSTAYKYITGINDDLVDTMSIVRYGSVFSFNVTTNNGSARIEIADTIVEDSQWHLLTGTYDGINAKFYVDGQLEGTTAKVGSIVTTSPSKLSIGCQPENTNNLRPEGIIDNVRYLNDALSATEVETAYNNYLNTDSINLSIIGTPPFNLNEYYSLQIDADVSSFTPTHICIYSDPYNPLAVTKQYLYLDATTYNFQLNPYVYAATYTITVKVRSSACANSAFNELEQTIEIVLAEDTTDSTTFYSDINEYSYDTEVTFGFNIDLDYHNSVSGVSLIVADIPNSVYTFNTSTGSQTHTYGEIVSNTIYPYLTFYSEIEDKNIKYYISLPADTAFSLNYEDQLGGVSNIDGTFTVFYTSKPRYDITETVDYNFNIPNFPNLNYVNSTLHTRDSINPTFALSGTVISGFYTESISAPYSSAGLYSPYVSHNYTNGNGNTVVYNIYLGGNLTAPPQQLAIFTSGCPDVLPVSIFAYCQVIVDNSTSMFKEHFPIMAFLSEPFEYFIVLTSKLTSNLIVRFQRTGLYLSAASFIDPPDGIYTLGSDDYVDSNMINFEQILDESYTIERRSVNTTPLDDLLEFAIYMILFSFVVSGVISFFND